MVLSINALDSASGNISKFSNLVQSKVKYLAHMPSILNLVRFMIRVRFRIRVRIKERVNGI